VPCREWKSDLSQAPDLRSLDDDLVKKIRHALLENLVIFFRNQDLDPAAFLAFTTHFGQPVEYPFVKGIDGFPEIIQVLKRESERISFGGIWHADTTYLDEPPIGTVLLAREVPPYRGDTLFADQIAADEALSDGLKQTLNGLRAVNTSTKADASRTHEDRIKDSGIVAKDYSTPHPVVRKHPETGRKALYINVAHTARFNLNHSAGASGVDERKMMSHSGANSCSTSIEQASILIPCTQCQEYF
jgi:taurine dioxygenase